MSAALPGASGTLAASRAATITIWRRELPGPAPDHVHELVARVREPLHDRTVPSRLAANPRASKVSATSCAVARSPVEPGAPVGRLGGDPRREPGGLVAVEEHVGGQPLRKRRGPALEREHRHEQGQERRHERRAVYPRLNHGGSTYNPEG